MKYTHLKQCKQGKYKILVTTHGLSRHATWRRGPLQGQAPTRALAPPSAKKCAHAHPLGKCERS